MESGVAAQWAVVGVALISQAALWLKNGHKESRNETEERTQIKDDIKVIKDRLDDPDNGLAAIKRGIDEQKLNCASVSTRLSTRLNGMEKRSNHQ